MKEQGFEDEFDEIDEIAKFVLLSIDGKPAGTCRYFPSNEEGDAHIGRMAVRKFVSWTASRDQDYDSRRKWHSSRWV